MRVAPNWGSNLFRQARRAQRFNERHGEDRHATDPGALACAAEIRLKLEDPLGRGFRLVHASEFGERRGQEHMGDAETGFAANSATRRLRRIVVSAVQEMAHANAVQSCRDPWIERTETDTSLTPFDCAFRISAPTQNQGSPKVCPGCRGRDRKRRLEYLLSQSAIMFDQTDRNPAVNKG
jgi:hypothetical protein